MSTSDHPRRNGDRSFAGIDALKREQAEELARFERWAAAGNWRAIHEAHFDWWMFPIDEDSRLGTRYTVYEGDIAELKRDPAYVHSYLRGVELLMLAWGWDLAAKRTVASPQPGQRWNNWPIRLYKAARSLQLFGFTAEFESLRTFALELMQRGEQLRFGGQDLSVLFTEGRPRSRGRR
ncbi:MAG: hypothetical protein RLZZ387_2239 [Chloroflexota bacterium]|jgi:hypothetical protein